MGEPDVLAGRMDADEVLWTTVEGGIVPQRFAMLRDLLDCNIPVGSDRLATDLGEVRVQGSHRMILVEDLVGEGRPTVSFEGWDEQRESFGPQTGLADYATTSFGMNGNVLEVFRTVAMSCDPHSRTVQKLSLAEASDLFDALERELVNGCRENELSLGFLQRILVRYRRFCGEALDHS